MSAAALGTIMALAIGAGVRQYLAAKASTPRARVMATVLGVLAAGVGGAAGALLTSEITRRWQRSSAIEAAMVELGKAPLVGALITEHTSVAEAVRGALDASTPVSAVLQRARQTYVIPALKAAPDREILSLWSAQKQLVQHLQTSGQLQACKEYAFSSIGNVDSLDPRGRQLFYAVLSQTEAAYRVGRGRAAETLPSDSDLQRFGPLLVAGNSAVFDSPSTASPSQACEATKRMHEAVELLPAPHAARFARLILASQ